MDDRLVTNKTNKKRVPKERVVYFSKFYVFFSFMDIFRAFLSHRLLQPALLSSICSEFKTISINQPAKVVQWVEQTFGRLVVSKPFELLIHGLKTCELCALLTSSKGYKAEFTFSLFDYQTEKMYHKTIKVRPIKMHASTDSKSDQAK